MVTGKTKNLAVIGNPIAHSLSPMIQNAALQKAGLDFAYIAIPVKEAELPIAVEGFRAMNFRGFNVTIPHKTAIMSHLDAIDADAQIIGAVNTVVNTDGKLTGYNTDVIGFLDGLTVKGFDVKNKNAVMLGAGGAARAIIWGLIKSGAGSLAIGVRNPQKAQPIAEYFAKYLDVKIFDWQTEEFDSQLTSADLLINTTPLGMSPAVDAMPPVNWNKLKKTALVYDIIYTPQQTKFLAEAKENGHETVNGEVMLVGQGAAAFHLWTGKAPDTEVMLKALRNSLS